MKKRGGLLGILWMFLLLCGCAVHSGDQIAPETLQISFMCPAKIQIEEKEYACEISHDLTQCTIITFKEENSVLQNLEFKRKDGDIFLRYGDLEYGVSEKGFPEQDALIQIADALDAAQAYLHLQAGAENTFTGTTADGISFTLTAEKDGTITRLQLANNTCVQFEIENGET